MNMHNKYKRLEIEEVIGCFPQSVTNISHFYEIFLADLSNLNNCLSARYL